MSSRSNPSLRAQHGFTLLEVLFALMILAGLTAMMTTNFVGNIERASNALSHRELREAADTIFRKMIYETEEYTDGDEGRLDEIYGEFARLKRWQRDRWAIYRYTLEKSLTNVVGVSQDADESLFGDDETVTTEDTSTSGTSEEAAEGEPTGIELMKMTLRIYNVEGDVDQAPLLTLVTWYDPNRGQVAR